jgi:predicted CoA-binding protein
VIPVNTHEAEVEGHRAYRSVLEVPGSIDMATVYVPPESGLVVVEELARKGVPEVWLNPGADDDAIVERARALGLIVIQACSITGIGESPSRFCAADDGLRHGWPRQSPGWSRIDYRTRPRVWTRG